MGLELFVFGVEMRVASQERTVLAVSPRLCYLAIRVLFRRGQRMASGREAEGVAGRVDL